MAHDVTEAATGNAFDGSGGGMKFAVGDSGYNDGGDIITGDTRARGGVGAAVQIGAGRGLHDDRRNGGSGGEVVIVGGGRHGLNKETSFGKHEIFFDELMHIYFIFLPLTCIFWL